VTQEIFRPGLNQILSRTLSMKGARGPAGLLTPEINPSIVLENDRWEYHALGGSKLVSAYSSWDQAIPAGQVIMEFQCGAGQLMVCDYATATVLSDGDAFTGPCCVMAYVNAAGANSVGGTTVTSFPTDTRWGTAAPLGVINAPAVIINPPGTYVDHKNLSAQGNVTLLHRGYPMIVSADPKAAAPAQFGIAVFTPPEAVEVEILLNFRIRPIEDKEISLR